MVLLLFDAILCGGGIQPERLNAEGEARVLVAEGGASAQPPEYRHHQEKRLEDAKVDAEKADFRVFQTHNGGCHDTEGYASLHPRLRATRSARAFDLSGHAAVIGCGKQVIIRKCVKTPFLRESPLSQIAVAGVILSIRAL